VLLTHLVDSRTSHRPWSVGGSRAAPPLRPLQANGLGRGRSSRPSHRDPPHRRTARGTARPKATIREEILDPRVQRFAPAFTQSYGSTRLDALVLLMPHCGFLPSTDPRIVATVDAIQRDLTRDSLALRYTASDNGGNIDGVPGDEGSSWLAPSGSLTPCMTSAHRRSSRTIRPPAIAGATTSACSAWSPSWRLSTARLKPPHHCRKSPPCDRSRAPLNASLSTNIADVPRQTLRKLGR
jgi:hypothetical protein